MQRIKCYVTYRNIRVSEEYDSFVSFFMIRKKSKVFLCFHFVLLPKTIMEFGFCYFWNLDVLEFLIMKMIFGFFNVLYFSFLELYFALYNPHRYVHKK